jgi:hypothetical protein
MSVLEAYKVCIEYSTKKNLEHEFIFTGKKAKPNKMPTKCNFYHAISVEK